MLKNRFPRRLSIQLYPSRSQGGWSLRGFGQIILGFSFIALVLFFLASTSFFSDCILKNMMKFPVVVNPIAAASHQNAQQEYISEVSETKIAPHHSSVSDRKHHLKAEPASQLESSSATTSAAEAFAIARVTDINPDKKLDLVALTPRIVWDSANQAGAQAIVVLGGGLTRDKQGRITPNSYTRLRLMQAISQHRSTSLPIFLTGVESRYMQKFLQEHGESAQWLESRSMNTCENARFSALLLQRLGGAPRVELVTDKWHIPRARWLFAMNGIETVPIPALLPGDPAPWWPDSRNLTHTRRALYELVAFTRDRWFGVVGCREVP
ncbi:MAG: YdcF family protein [Candidatus Saccharibacteria bacterium]|nr:YdcF family protein [Moraxellaceae bacterium]